jgi:stage V sporulation protein AE
MDWMLYVKAFFVGGALCALGQLGLSLTRLTSARILVVYVTAGVVLGAAGLYGPLADWAGAGATVPLTGFGYALSQGAKKAVQEHGLIGAFTGGITAAAAGIAAAITFGYLFALLARPRTKM